MSANNPQEKRLVQVRVNGVQHQQEARHAGSYVIFCAIHCI